LRHIAAASAPGISSAARQKEAESNAWS
jgi:hypothetical protein